MIAEEANFNSALVAEEHFFGYRAGVRIFGVPQFISEFSCCGITIAPEAPIGLMCYPCHGCNLACCEKVDGKIERKDMNTRTCSSVKHIS